MENTDVALGQKQCYLSVNVFLGGYPFLSNDNITITF